MIGLLKIRLGLILPHLKNTKYRNNLELMLFAETLDPHKQLCVARRSAMLIL
jgi:hypothetical protein